MRFWCDWTCILCSRSRFDILQGTFMLSRKMEESRLISYVSFCRLIICQAFWLLQNLMYLAGNTALLYINGCLYHWPMRHITSYFGKTEYQWMIGDWRFSILYLLWIIDYLPRFRWAILWLIKMNIFSLYDTLSPRVPNYAAFDRYYRVPRNYFAALMLHWATAKL